MNLCSACRVDFASVAAFDRHRVGVHEYTFLEGLAQTPPVEDGRRCMDADEMADAGMELNPRRRWHITADAARVAEYFKYAA